MNGLASANSKLAGFMGASAPNLIWLFSVSSVSSEEEAEEPEEALTFGWGSSPCSSYGSSDHEPVPFNHLRWEICSTRTTEQWSGKRESYDLII